MKVNTCETWHALACKKIGSRLCGSELGLEVLRQKHNKAADD